MLWSIRRSAFVLGILAVVASFALAQQAQVVGRRAGGIAAVPAQPGGPGAAKPQDPDAFNSAVDLPKDNERRRMIEAAQDYIDEKKWDTACSTLQKLLMYPEDKMVEVVRTVDNVPKKVWVSARREAERIIGALPADGLEFYKRTFAPDAKELLDKAKETGRKEDLAIVMNYYLHTDAGGVATHLLATRLLDRGDYITACLCYERLLYNREGADKLPATVLFEAAYAYHLAGNKDKEEEMWKQLGDRVGSTLKLGNDLHSLDDLKDRVAKVTRLATDVCLADTTVVGGSPSRNAKGIGGYAFLEPRWHRPLIHDNQSNATDNWLKTVDGSLRRRPPIISANQPITVTINQEGKPKPLIVYRTYGGLEAVDLVTGKLAWDSPSKWGIETMLATTAGGKSGTLNSWLNFYVTQNQRPGIVYENSIVGTLSTDGTYVFAIEDLPVPPPPQFQPNMGFPNGGNPQQNFGTPELNQAVLASKLQAFELSSNGKLKWEVGGVGKDVPLAESYFLGPPLPMGGKLYVLTERQQELRLACIDPNNGKVLSTQVLVTTREKIQNDVGRRTQAAHLAYGEGVLVCPTNAGAVLGVDLLTNSLVWAYNYREETAAPSPEFGGRQRGFGGPGMPGMMGGPVAAPNTAWKVTPPIVQDGKVIFTAPDAGSIHCLNLRDGTPVWTQKRAEEDLYLGGVFNRKVIVVGKRQTKAYSLEKGDLAWTLDTGVPSGFGVASDGKDGKALYYLPVRETPDKKEPEICVLDIEKGQIWAHTKSRTPEIIPGSLLFYEGDVLSQTEKEIVAFPQLDIRKKEVDALLASNPNDPVGLTDRGELNLGKGELQAAVDDFTKALDQLKENPNKATKEKATVKLYETLTDFLGKDFNKAEKFLDKYDELCKNVEVDPSASGDDKTKAATESRRRLTMQAYLLAKGRESQGRLIEAFDKYQEYCKLAGTDKLIAVPADMAVHTAPDVLTSAHIKAMVEGAKPDQRKPLEQKIVADWDNLKIQNDPTNLDDIRQFVRLFGSAFPVGKEARLELANRLIESSEPHALIEAELNLAMLRGAHEDQKMAARAVETLARLNAHKGLLADAAFYYRELRDRYPDVVIRDGLTGAAIFHDMESNKFVLPHLYEVGPVALTGKVSKGEEVKPPPQGFQFTGQSGYTFDQLGEELPFFKQYRIALQTGTHNLLITNRYTAEPPRMDKHLTTTHFAQMLNIWNPTGLQVTPKYNFQNMGHLVVLPLGHMVFGIDPVSGNVLWEKNLYGMTNGNGPPQWAPQNPNTGMPAITVDPRDNAVQILYIDGWMQRIGQTTSLEGQVVCLQTRDSLVAIDPLNGRTLWTRSDLSPRSQILSDEDHFYIVELNAESNPSSTRILRAQDGVSVQAPDFALLFQKRLRMSGRNLLLSENDDIKKKVFLRLYDVLKGKNEWEQEFPAKSVAIHSEDPNLSGVVEPDGTLHVFDMRKPGQDKELFKNAKINPKHLEKVQHVVLIGDDKDLYVACNGEIDQNLMPWGGIQSNLMPGTGLRSLTINGEFYSFKRGDGELNWHNPVLNQMLVLEHFKEMPILLFTSRYNSWANQGAVRNVINVVATETIEKQSGKLKYFKEDKTNQMQQFHTLNVDLKGGKIELTSWNMKLVHQLLAPGKDGEKPTEKPSPTGRAKGAQIKEEETRRQQEALDREQKLRAIQAQEAADRLRAAQIEKQRLQKDK